MSKITLHEPRGEEMPVWRDIWESVFGSVGMEAFFVNYFTPGVCVTAEFDGTPAAMGFLVPFGEIVDGSKPIPCMMIYSVATLPEFRGKGLGSAVVRKLIERSREYNSPAVVLCPSEDGLFEYYSARTELRDFFYVNEIVFRTAPDSTKKILPVEVSVNDYSFLRENLLKDIIHIKHDLCALKYQAELCKELDGGLYKIDDSCAVIERQADGAVWVKELLIPEMVTGDSAFDSYNNDIIASIAEKYPAEEYVVRIPSRNGEGRRFGMLVINNRTFGFSEKFSKSPWYGVAFD